MQFNMWLLRSRFYVPECSALFIFVDENNSNSVRHFSVIKGLTEAAKL